MHVIDNGGAVRVDPPYNVAIDGNVSGLGKNQHREFVQASGEMSRPEFVAFLTGTLQNLVDYSLDGSLHYLCMDWRHSLEIQGAGEAVYSELKNICVWAKTNAGMGSLYRSQHEFVYVFKAGKSAHINNIQLGRYGRARSNVWTYAGATSFGVTREADLRHASNREASRDDCGRDFGCLNAKGRRARLFCRLWIDSCRGRENRSDRLWYRARSNLLRCDPDSFGPVFESRSDPSADG